VERPAAGCCARGGEGIPATRSARARLGAALASALVAAGTGGWLALAAEDDLLTRGSTAAAATAVVCLAAGLAFRVALAIPIAVALLGAEYAALLAIESDTLDARAPLVAAALLAVAELGYWSLELQGRVADEAGTYLRRIALLAASLLGVLALGAALMAAVDVLRASGPAVEVLGAAAAVGALALVALAARVRG
jgi:hypothetical protein